MQTLNLNTVEKVIFYFLPPRPNKTRLLFLHNFIKLNVLIIYNFKGIWCFVWYWDFPHKLSRMSRSSFTNKLSVINPVLSRTICFNSNFKEKYRTSWLNKPRFSETSQNDVLIEQKGEYPFKWRLCFWKLKTFFSRRPYGSILFRFFRKHSS